MTRPSLSRVAASGFVLALLVPALPAHAASPVPFKDPAAVGYLSLCDQSGTQITSGALATAPFVQSAVGSAAAPTAYSVPDSTATLYAFQPRENVPAASWSGEQLTAASRFSTPDHPTAQATAGDSSLGDFVADYPAQWEGLVQLRLYLGAPGRPVDSLSYSAATLKVADGRWTQLDAGASLCSKGMAVSVETLLLPKSALTPRPTPSSAAAATEATASPASATVAAVHDSKGVAVVVWSVLGVGVAAAIGAVSWLLGRRSGKAAT